ncbi:hypothetical protein A6E15_13395 [Natrinema saccharevitans]|uniref:Uncharacterized protein n=1 Tax=Natrinema saccharevitans TaxID=301967 RepID=A0A1S8AYW0_9EURY|nr:hypothetical protein [Natrinema saccharevitans]OLZ41915.1 hypothetical protein A6E15_13395 [Natrinema saccharevitans]
MGQRHLEAEAAPSIDCAARRLEVDSAAAVARAAFDHAGELATLVYDRPAAVLGAVRLAARRTDAGEPDRAEIAATFDVDPERVVAADELLASHLGSPADELLASHLGSPADADEIRSLRRALLVAREVLTAVDRDRNAGPELPGSRLADAAPALLARASEHLDPSTDYEHPGLEPAALRAHVERLEADLEFARLGPRLYALVRENAGKTDDA